MKDKSDQEAQRFKFNHVSTPNSLCGFQHGLFGALVSSFITLFQILSWAPDAWVRWRLHLNNLQVSQSNKKLTCDFPPWIWFSSIAPHPSTWASQKSKTHAWLRSLLLGPTYYQVLLIYTFHLLTLCLHFCPPLSVSTTTPTRSSHAHSPQDYSWELPR